MSKQFTTGSRNSTLHKVMKQQLTLGASYAKVSREIYATNSKFTQPLSNEEIEATILPTAKRTIATREVTNV